MSDSQFQFLNDDSDNLVGKIVQASTLESEGKTQEAIALYQEIVEIDPSGNYGNVAREALANLQSTESSPVFQSSEIIQSSTQGLSWQNLSLKFKVPLLAIVLSTIPVLAVGTAAYQITDKVLSQEISRIEKFEAINLQDKINQFMGARFEDLQIMAGLDVFTNSSLSTTNEEKIAALEKIKKVYKVYDRIAIFNLQGELIAQTQGDKLDNHFEKLSIPEILEAKSPVFSQPIISATSGTVSVYSSATIQDKLTGKPIGFIRASIPVKYLKEVLQNYHSSDKEYYLINDAGEVFLDSAGKHSSESLSSATNGSKNQSQRQFTNIKQIFGNIDSLLSQSQASTSETTNLKNNRYQLLAYVPPTQLAEVPNPNWGLILAIDEDAAFQTQKSLGLTLFIGTVAVTILVGIVASILATKLTQPIVQAADAVKQLGQGKLDTRISVSGKDELAVLGSNINKMAGQIEDLLFTQESETKRQQREKENLQQGVMSLLLDVEGAKQGDLTVRAEMTDGAVGSIADAFNSTMKKLQELLQEVQKVSGEVNQLSLTGEDSVRQLSESALSQAEAISQALSNIDAINQSVETVANYAQEAAQIARQGSIQAKEGDLAMDATVNSIEKIRTTVANTAKKVKQLAESSQEIAQIVEIISGISEKTNLLAFNASVEAARAGEHGEGFRIVAEEVRRLADRITDATKDVQQLVTAIQQDTTSVLEGMETSTSEVVNGSELVRMTKLNLRSLAETSQQIDQYLKSISSNTINQSNTSKQVNEQINGIALVAKTNSTEAQNVVRSLRTLVQEVENLQSSVSQFKLQA